MEVQDEEEVDENNAVRQKLSFYLTSAAELAAARCINTAANPGSGNFTHGWLPRRNIRLPESALPNLGRKQWPAN